MASFGVSGPLWDGAGDVDRAPEVELFRRHRISARSAGGGRSGAFATCEWRSPTWISAARRLGTQRLSSSAATRRPPPVPPRARHAWCRHAAAAPGAATPGAATRRPHPVPSRPAPLPLGPLPGSHVRRRNKAAYCRHAWRRCLWGRYPGATTGAATRPLTAATPGAATRPSRLAPLPLGPLRGSHVRRRYKAAYCGHAWCRHAAVTPGAATRPSRLVPPRGRHAWCRHAAVTPGAATRPPRLGPLRLGPLRLVPLRLGPLRLVPLRLGPLRGRHVRRRISGAGRGRRDDCLRQCRAGGFPGPTPHGRLERRARPCSAREASRRCS
jgi:hypothetical protein